MLTQSRNIFDQRPHKAIKKLRERDYRRIS